MFTIEELGFILKVLKDSSQQDSMKDDLINRIKNIVDECKSNDVCLWRFCWDCRGGEVEGIFRATKEEVEDAIGKKVYFGEILGKHSEVCGTIEEGEITLVADNPIEVQCAIESGYNPLEYLSYKCPMCNGDFEEYEYNISEDMCDYCYDKLLLDKNE